jgi:hypothetical protein
VVYSVVSVPLKPDADYRGLFASHSYLAFTQRFFLTADLPLHKQQWQTSSALSAVARQKYRRGQIHATFLPHALGLSTCVFTGMYGRLNENNCFPTTVTNMEPTAKQSRVLNPWVCGPSF